jgi:hypothetical protein
LRALVVDRYFSFSQVDIRMSEGPVVEKGRLKGSLDVRMPDGFRNSGAYRLFDTAQLVAALYGRSLRESYLLSTGLTMRDLEKGSLGIDIPLPEGAMEGVGKLKWGIRTAIPGHPSLNSTEFVIERR